METIQIFVLAVKVISGFMALAAALIGIPIITEKVMDRFGAIAGLVFALITLATAVTAVVEFSV